MTIIRECLISPFPCCFLSSLSLPLREEGRDERNDGLSVPFFPLLFLPPPSFPDTRGIKLLNRRTFQDAPLQLESNPSSPLTSLAFKSMVQLCPSLPSFLLFPQHEIRRMELLLPPPSRRSPLPFSSRGRRCAPPLFSQVVDTLRNFLLPFFSNRLPPSSVGRGRLRGNIYRRTSSLPSPSFPHLEQKV